MALQDRLVLPDPSHEPNAQTVAYYTAEGSAETLIKNLVSLNAGSQALPERKTFGLEIAADQGRGSSTKAKIRLKNLLDEVASLAKANNFVIECMQKRSNIIFDVRTVQDKSRSIRLTSTADELTEWQVSFNAPSATAVVVGGQGEGANRTLFSKRADSQWGHRRTEIFKDQRDTNDLNELIKSADDQLRSGIEKIKATFTVVDSEARKFGRDYLVGDIVTVSPVPGTIFTEQITTANVTWENGIRTVELTIGNTDEDQISTAEQRKINQVSQQLLDLQTK